MTRMRWNRSKPAPRAQTTRQERRLEAQADHLLLKSETKTLPQPDSKRQQDRANHELGGRFYRSSPPKEGEPERAYFRSVGSVLFSGSRWVVLNSDGSEIATFATRWEAWRAADKLGMERAGVLG